MSEEVIKTSEVKATEEKPTSEVKLTAKPTTPVDNKVAKLMQELVNECIALSLAVASSDCDCEVCKEAKKIARIVKKLYRLRPKQ